MSRTNTNRRSALLMAAYAMLLVIGAAVPMATSYARGTSRQVSDGSIQCGGYNRRVEDTITATDEAESKTRPLTVEARSEAAQPTQTRDIECSAPHEWVDHSRFRGS